jgi:hypothetical protein
MFAFFVLFISDSPKVRGLGFIKALSVPFLLFWTVVAFRIGMDYFGLMTLFGNPLFAALQSNTLPLIIGLKRLISF